MHDSGGFQRHPEGQERKERDRTPDQKVLQALPRKDEKQQGCRSGQNHQGVNRCHRLSLSLSPMIIAQPICVKITAGVQKSVSGVMRFGSASG